MEHLSEILFICLTLPMVPMLFILHDKRSRLFLGYMIIGESVCLIAGAINVPLLDLFGGDTVYVTTNIIPISEEILKAVPVLYYAILFSDDRPTLLSISFALGIGFAVLENAVILGQSIESVSIEWAVVRVVGAALMHAACTSAVGMGMSYIKKRRKLFFCGTFALLITSIIFHATFNVLIQSKLRPAALIMPTAVYIPIVIAEIKRRKKEKNVSE